MLAEGSDPPAQQEANSAQIPDGVPLEKRVADSSALPEGGRLHLTIEGRYVTLLRVKGVVSCIDSICFHAGGPLGLGEIEELDGHACLVCPWHYYKIDIHTGDKYFQSVNWVNNKMVPGDWKSNGIKQRVHPVVERDGGIFAQVGEAAPELQSDTYAFNMICGDRLAAGAAAPGGPQRMHSTRDVGGDGRKPSGRIIQLAREAAHAVSGNKPLPPSVPE